MKKSKVAILRTSPGTVLDDYQKLMHLAGYKDEIDVSASTILKVNISWQHFFPACSTTPWQLEGVIKTLLKDDYPKERISACHNRTVVVSARKGEKANKHLGVVEK